MVGFDRFRFTQVGVCQEEAAGIELARDGSHPTSVFKTGALPLCYASKVWAMLDKSTAWPCRPQHVILRIVGQHISALFRTVYFL